MNIAIDVFVALTLAAGVCLTLCGLHGLVIVAHDLWVRAALQRHERQRLRRMFGGK